MNLNRHNILFIPDFSCPLLTGEEKSDPSDSEGLQDQTRREFGLFCRVSQILPTEGVHKIVPAPPHWRGEKNPGLPCKIDKSSSDLPNDPFGANFACRRRAKFGFIIIVSAFLITGCQTFNAPSRYDQTWISGPQKVLVSSDNIWSNIHPPNIDTSRPLSLVDLIDIGLSNNPNTQQYWYNACAAYARQLQAESAYYPKITLSAQGTKEDTVSVIPAINTNVFKYGPSIQITYLLLDFGGRGAAVEEAAQLLLSANFQFNQSIQDELLDIEVSYYELYSAQANLEAAQVNLADAKTSLEAAEKKFEAELAAKLDVFQARSNYENSLYLLEQAKGDIKTAKADLAKAIGVCADVDFKIAVPSKDIVQEIKDDDVSAIIKDALDRRPDISAIQASLTSKESSARIAKSALYPTINTGASYEKDWYKNSGKYGYDHGYSAYLKFDWDIFDGFYNINKLREAQINIDIERTKLNQTALAISADVWMRYYDFKTAARKLAYGQALLDTTQVLYDLALESYKAGLKDILDLLDGENKLADARSKLIQSRQDLFVALAQLAHATGSINAKEENIIKE